MSRVPYFPGTVYHFDVYPGNQIVTNEVGRGFVILQTPLTRPLCLQVLLFTVGTMATLHPSFFLFSVPEHAIRLR